MTQINSRFVRFVLGILVVATVCLTVAAMHPAPAMAACSKPPREEFTCLYFCQYYTGSSPYFCLYTNDRVKLRGTPGDYEFEQLYRFVTYDYSCGGCPGTNCPSYCN
jgi:hypothetical protein